MLLKNGKVIDPASGRNETADILIRDGLFDRIASNIKAGQSEDVIDCSGLIVAPGFIDVHTHLREPGREDRETVATGAAAAAAGGFTAVCCMANTEPVNDNRAITEFIIRRSQEAERARVYPIAAATRCMKGETLTEMAELSDAGAVAFSDDGKPIVNSRIMRYALQYAAIAKKPVISHAEDPFLFEGGVMHEGEWSAKLGLQGIPGETEEIIVSRNILLAKLTGGRLHFAHISTEGSVALIRRAKKDGLRITAEVTPHHLVLNDDALASFMPNFKMNPPLRPQKDSDALLIGLLDGTLDCIATDHAPHTIHDKELEIDKAPFGVIGLETAIPILLDRLVNSGKVPLPTLIDRLTRGPAKAFNLPGGRIAEGLPADITALDLKRGITIDPANFKSKAINTPFAGWRVKGTAVLTIVGGKVVHRMDA